MKSTRYGLIGLAILLAVPAPARADEKPGESLKDVLAQLAKKVTDVCGGLKPAQASVSIGEFTGSQDALRIGVGGGSIMSELASVFGGFAKTDAALELNGQVFLVEDPTAKGLKAIRIKAKLTNKSGDDVAEFKEFTGFIRNATDFARLTGATLPFKKDGEFDGKPGEGRRRDTQDVLPPKPGEKPKVVSAFVKGSVVRSHEASPYDVEILCGPTAKGPFAPLAPTLLDNQFPGLPFVEIPKGHYYQVRVKNNDACRLGIFLHLDGIDQFTFSEDRGPDGKPKFRFWVVDAGKSITIEGYHKNLNPGEVFGFLTTEHGKGAASKFPTQIKAKVGTICVGLTREKQPGEKGGQETVPGDVIPVKQKVVAFKLGEINEFVTVRYSR